MKRLIFAAVCLAAMAACSKEQGLVQVIEQTTGSETVLATAKDFVMDGNAKTSITQSGSDAPAFAWKEGDIIGIIPMNAETVQSNYKVSEIGSNPRQASFDGGVWALKEGKGYAAYYPFKKEAAISNESIGFSFLGQTQSADNSLEHLGAYDYMYASAVVPQSGSAQFDFEHRISLVRLQLTVPKADTYTRVVLESSESWFASGASLKLSDGAMAATETVKSATINLNNIAVAANGVLTVWFATLPTSALSGQTLSVKLFGGETTCTGELTGFTAFTAGSAYSYAATLTSEGQEVEYVDLGLSVMWATCNLGAKSIEEYGDYYAWGETETKTTYTESTYKFIKVQHFAATEDEYDNDGFLIKKGQAAHDESRYTKYIPQSMADQYGYEGFYDNKTVLDPEDDVAHVKLGGKWRMPTRAEFEELRTNCTLLWTNYKGVNGIKFTSKKSGYTDKWIFLPAAGCLGYDSLYNVGTIGYYWSSSLFTYPPGGAYDMYFYSDAVGTDGGYYRYGGQSVRSVYDNSSSCSEEDAKYDIITCNIYNDSSTKTTLSSDNFLLWSQSDSIIVTNLKKEGSFTYSLKSGAGTQSAGFQAICSPRFTDDDTLIGLSDLPSLNDNTYMWLSEQECSDRMNELYCPMIASRDFDTHFTFRPAGGLIFFKLTGAGTVSCLEFSADESMSGPVMVNDNAEISLSTQGVNSIRLVCGTGIELDADEYKIFKMAIPSNEYHNITVTVTGSGGKQVTKKSSNSISVQRGKILNVNLGNVDISGPGE